MNIRAVLFDLDDTLYERKVAFKGWAETFVRMYNDSLTDLQVTQTVTELETLDANGYGDRHRFVAELTKQFPTVTGSPVEILETFRVGFLEQISLTPEIRELLQALQVEEIPFGIITNGSTIPQTRKIKHLGLDTFTDCIFISESFGVKKPHPAIFHAAAECLNVPPEHIVFAGDHLENDIMGAKRAGMQTAWLHYGNTFRREEVAADYLLYSITELADILKMSGEPARY